ncbi:MAG: DUF4139 domain-containing protein [Phycisphaerales bacterium]|nr:DUF4139 domain-containing protein [Phycisphaerales bacterium]
MASKQPTAAALLVLAATTAYAGDTSLTVYNGGFGVVRETFPLSLKPGENKVVFADATAQVEASSVILRDAQGRVGFNILEQSYRNDPATQERLLEFYEGRTIDFIVGRNEDGSNKTVNGKIVRSGYTPTVVPLNNYGGYRPQPSYGNGQPIIEVDGQLRFGLPGQPLFPALSGDSILKPTLEWTLASRTAAQTTAEVGYVTNGMTWNADYNIVAPESGSQVDLLGWVTINNQTGKTFEDAKIQLMAGDVNRVQPQMQYAGAPMAARAMYDAQEKTVTEKAFDEFHLYTVERKTTLRDAETKQIEFVRGEDVTAEKIFVYDGASQGPGQRWYWGGYRNDNPGYMNNDQAKVWIMREFKNTKENGLGVPLPAGKLRFYTQDSDGTLQFVGENTIDHTPQGETVRVYTGNAFDLVGERKQTDFQHRGNWMRETYEIKVRNRKKERAEIRVVEHMFRWSQWEIEKRSMPFEKTDAQTIEFRVTLDPDEEQVVTYTVSYSW